MNLGFTEVNVGAATVTDDSDALPASAYIQELAIDPRPDGNVYAASNGAGLFRSTNGGASWERINNHPASNQSYVIKIDPKNPSRLYSGGADSGVWISYDRGDTWRCAGLEGVTINDLAIDPTNTGRLFVLSYGGIYRTNDVATKQWKLVFDYKKFLAGKPRLGPPDEPDALSRFQKIAINPHNPRQIIAGVRWEGGFRISDDGGETWRNEWISGIFRRVDVAVFHPTEHGVIMAGTHHQGMFKSWNGGKSWVSLSRGLAPQKRTPYYNAYLIGGLVIDPSNPDTLYSGSDYSSWKSTDGGVSWRELGRTLTCEFARTIAVDPNHPKIVYAGTNVGVYKSEDGGGTWLARNRGFPVREILQTCDATIGGQRFRYAVVKGQPAVYRCSLDSEREHGREWQPMSWMLYTDASRIDYDPARGELILQTPGGAVRSDDGGFRWKTVEMREGPRTPPNPSQQTLSAHEKRTNESTGSHDEAVTLNIEIEGDVFFDDTNVEPHYRRPPYVSLQIVTEDYPLDKSAPLFSANWERTTKGTLRVSQSAFDSAGAKRFLLYVEVRDFHRNTLVGWTPLEISRELNADAPLRLRVLVDAATLLPSLGSNAPTYSSK